MSEAATQALSPIRKTAQSSPTGTSTSGGAGGRRPEILRTTSSSFNAAFCRRGCGGPETSCSAKTPRARAPGPRPRAPPPGPPPRTVSPPRAGRCRGAASGLSLSVGEALCSLRSSLHLPYGLPEYVRFLPRIPGTQRTPTGFRDPHVAVVGRGLRLYLSPGMPGQKTHAGVELGIAGATPRLDPGPPGVLDPGPHAGLLVQLAAGATHEVLALF